jgi:hypothetical protein
MAALQNEPDLLPRETERVNNIWKPSIKSLINLMHPLRIPTLVNVSLIHAEQMPYKVKWAAAK